MTILIVEDHTVLLRAWQRAAQRAGIPVRCSASLESALDALDTDTITGVISDFHLGPRQTSLPALAHAGRLGIPIIITTGTSNDARQAIDDAGVEAEIIQKPIHERLEDLLRRISHPGARADEPV